MQNSLCLEQGDKNIQRKKRMQYESRERNVRIKNTSVEDESGKKSMRSNETAVEDMSEEI